MLGLKKKDTLLSQAKFQSVTSLYQHLAEVVKRAENMFDQLVESLAEKENITEQLKDNDMLLWVNRGREDNILPVAHTTGPSSHHKFAFPFNCLPFIFAIAKA